MSFIPKVYAEVDIAKEWHFATIPEFGSFGGIISFFLPRVLLVAGIVFFFLIVFAGFGMIRAASGGDPHAAEQAKHYLTYAVIGLIIIISSFWILQIVNFATSGSLRGIL